ncbi:comEA protein [Limihaloglobus sulfuriphilus]|uniref:ComEA protein n=1 Tax=Limihaloglobus sulfuriphilus TaxID=1851148 RepID=A0A1Q2MFG1_9BACT|nr:type II secretion system protein GspK [Limihaloglobus sulfuriphilus]AQQ71384.1 comEA protein [Limihaloglobus sulfuriphilus]
MSEFIRNKRNRATVLIIVIWVTLIIAALTAVFAQSVRVESIASANRIAAAQAEAAAAGAVDYVLALSGQQSQVNALPNDLCEAVKVGDAYFWLLRVNALNGGEYDFGIIDEAAKVNINSAPRDMLLNLPGMSSELAGSIIDWRDTDQDLTEGGAESEYYLLLDRPYYCKDDRLETVEEVLMIKGGGRESLFGEDMNRNGVLDWNENDGGKTAPDDNGNGVLDPCFCHYVTVYSYQKNVAEDGGELINVNDKKNMSRLSNLIKSVAGEDYFTIMNRIRTKNHYSSLIELFYTSMMDYDDFNAIAASLTAGDKKRINGLININTAPPEVLLCLPGLEQSDVDAIIQRRGKTGDQSSDTSSILWVTEVLSPEKAVGVGSRITVKSDQYSADIVAASSDGRAFRRYFVVIDTAQEEPRILLRQPLSHLGWPLDEDILDNLRDGKQI